MLKILTVCTGNLCRSPIAAQLITHKFSDRELSVASAGVRARSGVSMPQEAASISLSRGVPVEHVSRHISRSLSEADLRSVDLVLAMAREHRRAVVEVAPSALRVTFTLRELSRLMTFTTDAQLVEIAKAAPQDASSRLAAMLTVVSAGRAVQPPLNTPQDDDVIDPYGGSHDVYAACARQLDTSLPEVERLLKLAIGGSSDS